MFWMLHLNYQSIMLNLFIIDSKISNLIIAYPDKSGPFRIALWFNLVDAVSKPIILPTTFNDDKHAVALLNYVVPGAFNEEYIIVLLFILTAPNSITDILNLEPVVLLSAE